MSNFSETLWISLHWWSHSSGYQCISCPTPGKAENSHLLEARMVTNVYDSQAAMSHCHIPWDLLFINVSCSALPATAL